MADQRVGTGSGSRRTFDDRYELRRGQAGPADQRAIDLQTSTTGGVVINNSGNLLGDVLFGTAGNNNVLNIGNIGSNGSANAATGVANTPASYAVLAETVLDQTSGLPPLTQAATLDFGSGIGILALAGVTYTDATPSTSDSAPCRTLRVDDGTNQQTESLFGLWVHQGFHDPFHNAAHIVQGGLGLGDTADYVDAAPEHADASLGRLCGGRRRSQREGQAKDQADTFHDR